MIKVVRVCGRSMSPLLHDGDYLLVRKVLRSSVIRNGNIVTVKHPQLGKIVKAVIGVTPQTVKLTGISRLSTPVDSLGDIKKQSIDGVGVAIIPRNFKQGGESTWFRFLKNDDVQSVLAQLKVTGSSTMVG